MVTSWGLWFKDMSRTWLWKHHIMSKGKPYSCTPRPPSLSWEASAASKWPHPAALVLPSSKKESENLLTSSAWPLAPQLRDMEAIRAEEEEPLPALACCSEEEKSGTKMTKSVVLTETKEIGCVEIPQWQVYQHFGRPYLSAKLIETVVLFLP